MVRDVFRLAKENAPAIVFIDEVDAIATKRFDAGTGADREVQRILLELLNQMDGFDQTTGVKVSPLATPYPSTLTHSRSSWRLTEPTHWIPLCCALAVWTARWSSRCPTVDSVALSSTRSLRRWP